MGLGINILEREGVTMINLRGRIVCGDGVEQVIDCVKKLLDQGKRNLLINLDGVTKVDSCGLGAFVAGYTSATRQSASLKLLKPPKHVIDLFKITKLSTIFEAFDGESAAIRSFSEESPGKPVESPFESERDPAGQNEAATSLS